MKLKGKIETVFKTHWESYVVEIKVSETGAAGNIGKIRWRWRWSDQDP